MVETSSHDHRGECRSCPVCAALQVAQHITPEVRAHLLAAGRELLLAARAVLAAHEDAAVTDDVWTEPQRGTSRDTPTQERGRPVDGRSSPTLRRITVR